MTTAVTDTEGPVYYGIHHNLSHVEDGVVIRQTRERVSMVADKGALALTVVDDDSNEITVNLDLQRVDSLIDVLPELRYWMLNDKPAAVRSPD